MPISRWSIGPPTIQTEWPHSKVGGPLIDKLLPGSDLVSIRSCQSNIVGLLFTCKLFN